MSDVPEVSLVERLRRANARLREVVAAKDAEIAALLSTGFDGDHQAWRNIDGGTEEVPGGTAGAVHPDDVGGPAGPRRAAGSLPTDRGAAGDQPRDAALLGDPGRDRRRRPTGHDGGGDHSAARAGAGGSGAAPGERDPAVGIDFLRGGARPPLPLIVDYIEEHKDAFGVEPICTVLSSADVTIAPSTYYAARTRPPSARAVRDEEVTAEISKVHEENYGVYGVRKVHAQLGRDGGVHGRPVARCTVQRLMKAAAPCSGRP